MDPAVPRVVNSAEVLESFNTLFDMTSHNWQAPLRLLGDILIPASPRQFAAERDIPVSSDGVSNGVKRCAENEGYFQNKKQKRLR